MNESRRLRIALSSLSAYRNLLRLPVPSHLLTMLHSAEAGDGEAALSAWGEAFYLLHEEGFCTLSEYLDSHLRYDSSPYAELIARGGDDPALTAAAERDVRILRHLSAMGADDWHGVLARSLPAEWIPAIDSLPCWPGQPDGLSFPELTEFYRTHGAGLFSRYRAFLWRESTLIPVEHPDFEPPEALVGYTLQRDQVYANTASLMKGNRVNNVLLYGQSGTGKSATVKSLLGIPEFDALRLIEMDKSELEGIPELVRMLAHRPQKFILYIDDLAFDKDDRTYSQLKTILEGGLEQKPVNVAIYATSNRRHLVRETFSDRAGDEVDATETIEEKTSLSERFGLRIPFSTLNQDQYLELCYALADRAGVELPREQLRTQALRFSLRHPGRTPRVAQQLIQSLRAST